jgi:hypothetical protein
VDFEFVLGVDTSPVTVNVLLEKKTVQVDG